MMLFLESRVYKVNCFSVLVTDIYLVILQMIGDDAINGIFGLKYRCYFLEGYILEFWDILIFWVNILVYLIEG